MHIKQITISNFRSFRQQPEIQAFSPGTNAVIGRNGSGKSNYFDAVQFVLLAPRFANLRPEERQALLHEGSGSAAINAFVEICLDNSDGRFAVQSSDEVVIRRTVSAKKDEFFLQRKRVTKHEIQSLLEGAGFSKSNPYYIVQQGKVQDLCVISDKDRLKLLLEVAGTVTYDEKKAESLLKMQENRDSIDKVEEMLRDMDERLEQLQSEKEELTAYQSLDRQRRAAEYTLYDKELCKARAALDSLEHERADHVQTVSDLHEQAKESHNDIRNTEATLKTKSNVLRRNRNLTESLEEDMKQIVTRYTKLQIECQALEEEIENGVERQQTTKQELQHLEKEIRSTEKKLREEVQPTYDEAVKTLQDLTAARDQATSEMEALYAKQGRGRQFVSVDERDSFLQKTIEELLAARVEKDAVLTQERESLSNLRRNLQEEAEVTQSISAEVIEQSNSLQSISKALEGKKRERLDLHEQRKEEWRKAEESREQVREAREAMHRAVSGLRKVVPRATFMGLEALKTIVEQERLVQGKQYFGMVMENFNLRSPKYQTAVEMAAQNSLFHVIVDTDHTAARLMRRLEDGKLGRVTFLPLNQLHVDQVEYPNTNDVRSMLELCIDYKKDVEKAMQHVFAKKLIARTPEVASEWSAKLSMDAITLDGDLCSRKGALTGGYIDVNKSRLAAYAALATAQESLKKSEREYHESNRRAQELDHAATTLMQEIQRMEAHHASLSHSVAAKETALERTQARSGNNAKQVERIEKSVIPQLERDLQDLDADIARLRAEVGTELTDSLSEDDRKRLEELKMIHADLLPKIEAQNETAARVAVERQNLASLLDDNLLRRRRELTEGSGWDESAVHRPSRGRLSLVDLQAQLKLDLQNRHQELDEVGRTKDEVEARLSDARKTEESLRGELIAAKNELEQLKSRDMKNHKLLEEAQDKSERLLNKRAMCISKRETYMRKIQELGSLPPTSELEKFHGKSITELMHALDAVNKKLKKYSHVNKKAFDQFVNFSEQRESLLKRKDELDQGAEKVKELVDSLDRQKDEAINRTFRGVSAHFKQVFQELVPDGAGELIMRTNLDDVEDETDSENSDSKDSLEQDKKLDPKNPNVALYRGIGIKVRFSKVGETFMMSQLSGGQKALVALALIFSIQRCDPAPFYLFDELDQALDSSYRAAVANLIQRQANAKENPTQFIVSTFRPELVAVANRCYGVSHQNKVSRIHHLTKKDALHFIANLMNEDEAVGDVTAMPSSRSSKLGVKRKSDEVDGTRDEEDDKSSSGNESD